ncbi:hypothetical protein DFJ73DRAFT_360674 [Zopfochytrium polystomum]|nr:hypothetical protein DFJ73DRAFT_360674 [Zopfochytrium polystomum]
MVPRDDRVPWATKSKNFRLIEDGWRRASHSSVSGCTAVFPNRRLSENCLFPLVLFFFLFVFSSQAVKETSGQQPPPPLGFGLRNFTDARLAGKEEPITTRDMARRAPAARDLPPRLARRVLALRRRRRPRSFRHPSLLQILPFFCPTEKPSFSLLVGGLPRRDSAGKMNSRGRKPAEAR